MEKSLLLAPNKFRGAATARQVAERIGGVARDLGWRAVALPLSDGGEGLLDAFGAPYRSAVVTGPRGRPVTARRRLDGEAQSSSRRRRAARDRRQLLR